MRTALAWLHDPLQPFPNTSEALTADTDFPGLLAAGGELSNQRLRDAYTHGIFPWYGPGQPLLWWSPDPRMVLPVSEFKISRSFGKTLKKLSSEHLLAGHRCEIRFDSDLRAVMQHCADAPREGQSGTWIVPEMVDAYSRWHAEEQAVHSVETWLDGRLVGGLYAVSIGGMVFGESMFALETDASKVALAALVCFCRARGVAVIDCQQRTAHLASLGAREWPRRAFESHLNDVTGRPAIHDWRFDPSMWSMLN